MRTERPAPSVCRARGAASGRRRRASKPGLSHILSRPAFATSTARSPSGGHGGGVHVFRIEIPYRLIGYGMSGIVQVFGRRQVTSPPHACPRVRRTHTGICDTPIAIIALVRLRPRKAASAIARIAVRNRLRRPQGAQCRPPGLGVRSHHGRARQTATTLCPNGRPFGPHTCPRAFTRRD
jgi:hypothetical protein